MEMRPLLVLVMAFWGQELQVLATEEYCYPDDVDWLHFDGMCYWISESSGVERMSWDESRSHCNTMGGELLSIHGQEENAWLYANIQDVDSNQLFMGLREYGWNGIYIWSDGTPTDYVNWKPGEPNDYNGEEECGTILTHSDGGWNDQNCGVRLPFICKKFNHSLTPITYPPTTPMPGPCPAEWNEFDGRCYRLYGAGTEGDKLGWIAARNVCRNAGGDLATIHNQALQAFLTSLLWTIDDSVWIGLSDGSIKGTNKWTDGSPVDYTNWGSGQPRYFTSKTCVEVLNYGVHVGQWKNDDCNLQRGWICKGKKDVTPGLPKPTPDPCNPGYKHHSQGCYKVSTVAQNFEEAKRHCEDDGGNLASIMNVYEQALVETLVYQSTMTLWIGMVFNSQIQEYRWIDGAPVFFTKWANGEPSRGPTGGCVQATADGWDDTNCNDDKGYICKIYKSSLPTTPEPPKGHCTSGDWTPFMSNCYFFGGKDAFLDAPQAQFECHKRDGNLVSIHHALENEFIAGQMGTTGDVWIGLLRGAGGFRWMDNSPIQYTNWEQGEPSSVDEECTAVSRFNGRWRDLRCNSQRMGYICKSPMIMPTQSMTSPLAVTDKPRTQEVTAITGTQTAPAGEQKRKSGDGINISTLAAVVLVAAVVVISALAAAIWYIRKKRAGFTGEGSIQHHDNSFHFDNALYSEASYKQFPSTQQ
ncbi:macrophage mannose receptor 1-like [Ptychodera flava]|uniref:macrophage mannose receptor 1-like n=1 Tax=Ptychodera flava TaxID=63121 RepID=UPI00396AA3BC